MNKILGRILVKETNTGVPNLVVAAFDSDVAPEDFITGQQEKKTWPQ